jgi:hypothetical protein
MKIIVKGFTSSEEILEKTLNNLYDLQETTGYTVHAKRETIFKLKNFLNNMTNTESLYES